MPEWYFLPFYAILRSVPDKLMGVLLMFSAVGILAVLPWLDKHPVRSAKFRPLYRKAFWIFFLSCLALGWVGSQPPEGLAMLIGQVTTVIYFGFFLVVLPLLSRFEKVVELPESIDSYEKNKCK